MVDTIAILHFSLSTGFTEPCGLDFFDCSRCFFVKGLRVVLSVVTLQRSSRCASQLHCSSPFFIFNFQFSIFNFQFSIFNFQFSILNSQFPILPSRRCFFYLWPCLKRSVSTVGIGTPAARRWRIGLSGPFQSNFNRAASTWRL